MVKRKASVSVPSAELVTAALLERRKRPKLAVVTDMVYTPPAATIAENYASSYPSPLSWLFEDSETRDTDVDSLFDGCDAGRNTEDTNDADHDSLFSEDDGQDSENPNQATLDSLPVALHQAPSIPGLHFDPSNLIPEDLARSVFDKLVSIYFSSASSTTNQIMLFTRPTESLPAPLGELLAAVEEMLAPPALAQDVYDLLFAPREDGSTRQAIINRYAPGEGITPHVDLLRRYGDGIVGVSLGSGCAMAFAPVADSESEPVELYLSPRSVIALEGAARFDWTHGIPARAADLVLDPTTGGAAARPRDTRISVTFRWMLPGAHVVGPSS